MTETTRTSDTHQDIGTSQTMTDEQLERVTNDFDDDFDDDYDDEPSDQDMMSAFGTKWHDGL